MNFPEKYSNLLNQFNPKSAEEAFRILLKHDYANEITFIRSLTRKEKEINYLPKKVFERYPEFQNYAIKLSDTEKRIDKIVDMMRADIEFYNKHADCVRKEFKKRIDREICMIASLTERI
jgi:vacuolar-type H+-ATPase catalytic subunit A/Vma1